MNYRTLLRIVAGGLYMLISGTACSSGNGVEIDVSGTVVASGCDVSSTSQSVPVGDFSSATFKSVNDTSAEKDLPITLTNCSSDISGAAVTFSGTADADNADLLALSDTSGAGGMASGVGIEILDPNKKPVALNSLSDEIPLTAGDNALTFYLRYKATQIPVSPGNASSIMYFDLVYQ
ncbi:fimbrial protein [Enterobacter wuhouensis]|uniref:Fimbrial protein n=1 Tax=Enterobacter wuhouensis TaxID=2529381 RepID=A0ABZ1DLG3_9ENTR|nr:fimbrial protein [Enterobacter wuhouensis]MCV2531638.1 fimbrial protein [Enterobacter wuhouensis]WRW33134.1 fimbrial protein [Enterobacter wuhouensis]